MVVRLKRIPAGQQDIPRTNEILTMHLGPRDVLVNISLDVHDGLASSQAEEAIAELGKRIKMAHPEVKRVFIEAQSWQSHRLSQQHRDDDQWTLPLRFRCAMDFTDMRKQFRRCSF